ncbi:MAG: 4-hydroxy-tetrahydrodipicolinate synthase [Rhizobium sp.]|nr:MAG: 4-hydroxy-tetrahydrodipicolinate synthase [Rhizobium sp.]
MQQAFEGIWLPLVTPFRDGEVDLPAVRKMVEYYIGAGIHGLIVCGTTGEPATMSEEEQLSVLDAVLEVGDGRRPVFMGVSSNDTRDALRQLAVIQRRPVDGVLAVSPYYTRPSQEGLLAHFRALAQATALPLMLYNIPYRTGVNIERETIHALCELPNVVAIKESGGDINQLMDLIGDARLSVLSGEDHLAFTTLCLGGAGAVSAAAHLRPDLHVRMYEAFRSGDLAQAREISWRLLPLVRALFSEPNPAPVKALLARQGLIADELRLPMTPVSEACRARLVQALALLG